MKKTGFTYRPSFLNTPNFALDLALLGGAFLVAFVGSYSIYQTGWLYANAFAGAVLGALWVAVVFGRKLPWTLAVGTWVLTYIIAGSVLVGPGNESSFGAVLNRVFGVISAPVTGWKNILSLKIPLGTYHEVLAPVFFLAFTFGTLAFYLAWRSKNKWAFAAAAPLIPLLFGITFGSPTPASVISALTATEGEWLFGMGTVGLAFAWLVWRPLAWKRQAKTEVVDAEGKEIEGRKTTSQITRWALGVTMVVAAVAVSAVATPWVAGGKTRDVFRSNMDPVLTVTSQVSPLSTLRQYYGDELFDVEMLKFESGGETPRIRLATLTNYDGNFYTVTNPDDSAPYARVPAALKRDLDAEMVRVNLEILAYEGVWVPLPGALESIRFTGPNRQSLADGFFYSTETDTGVEVSSPGLAEGVEYRVESTGIEAATAIAGFEPGGDVEGGVEIPESLVAWVDSQEAAHTGAGLIEIIETMRERGYLSHGLLDQADESAKWAGALPDYTFAPSRSGHSLDRLNRMFTKLLEQEEAAGEDAKKELLVSMIGDDEQFAVAAALAAKHLGFNSRVAVGFRTTAVPEDPTLTYCEGGTCTGGDLSAWLEVQDAETGQWAAIDVTPQYEMTPAPKIERQSDPKHHTIVEPKRVETLPPPQAEPQTSDAEIEIEEEEPGFQLADSPIFRIAGLVLLGLFLLALPFLTILGAKKIRLWRRRRAQPLASQITGAWQSYLDAAVDAGRTPPMTGTRREIAAACSPRDECALALAENADYATFSAQGPQGYDSEAVWSAYQVAADRLLAGQEARARIRAKLSLRSLLPWSNIVSKRGRAVSS